MAHLRSYWTTQVECFPILVLVEEPAPPWVIKTTAGPESGPSESLEYDESWRHPKPKPPLFTDGDRVHMRGSKYVLELFLDEDRWHQVRAGRHAYNGQVFEQGLVHPCLYRGYVPMKFRSDHSTVAMKHYLLAKQNTEDAAWWEQQAWANVPEGAEPNDESEAECAESAPKKGRLPPRMGAPVALYVVGISAEALCRAIITGVAFLDARNDGVGLVKAPKEDEYGPGFTATMHPLKFFTPSGAIP